MAKTIFGTTEKSNFILNMDLDWYRKFCAKLLLIVLWATAAAEGINQVTNAANTALNDTVHGGGIGAFFALILVGLRSVATIFSIGGVLALIFTVVGLMRQQWTKGTAILYGITGVSLFLGIISMMLAYDYSTAVFGQDGRDEGWIALLMYAAMFFLGTMLRRKENQEMLLCGLMKFGIVQCIWGILQALPFLDYLNPNKGLNAYRNAEPMLIWNIRLPAGLTDNPVTFAMLLGMMLAIAIPAMLLAESKKLRVHGTVCAALSMLILFKTQTVAGLIAGCGAVLLMLGILIGRRGSLRGGKIAVPVTVAAAVLSFGWVFVTPALNHTYYRPDKTTVRQPEDGLTVNAWETDAAEAELPNGFTFPELNESTQGKSFWALYDGNVIWDDGFYRLSTAGPYVRRDDVFNVYDAASALRYARKAGWEAIKIDPLLGVGPDNFYFTQLHHSMSPADHANLVDRPYNDYLYIAATRGIPALLLHIALLAVSFVLAWRQRKRMTGWMLTGAGAAVLLYCCTAFVGISVLTVAPVFWVLLGVLAGNPLEGNAPEPARPAEKESAEKAVPVKNKPEAEKDNTKKSADTKKKKGKRK